MNAPTQDAKPVAWIDYVMILFAGVLYAIALKYFVLPSKVVLTGTEGIATAFSYYYESEDLFIWLYVVFQILLLGFAFAKVSLRFATRSFVTVATVVAALALLPDYTFADPEPQNERIILVLFGGILAGAAKALAFRRGGSTGDEDIMGAYFASKYLKPVGNIAIFAAIISTSFGLLMAYLKDFQFEPVVNTLMYTCIYIFASAETLNNLYRKFELTMLAIVTKKSPAVGKAILECSEHRTYIVQTGIGGRSGKQFEMVRTIITQEELPEMIAAVEAADDKCFLYHHQVDGISRHFYIPPIA